MRPDVEDLLLARAARSQVVGRLPSLTAGVVQGDALSWWVGRGSIDGTPAGPEPDADTQYRIGSITKTFVAVLVMRLRDEGRISLDDELERYVPGTPFGTRTVAQLLAQAGGVPAEPPEPWWERTPGPAWPEFLERLRGESPVLAGGSRFHYSNVGFALLGRAIEEVRKSGWADCVRREVLEPLSMTRTTTRPEAPAACGLAVHPWADVVLPEPEHDAGAMAPAGQLWSTLTDLARYAQVFLGQAPDVLDPATVELMAQPGVVDARPTGWNAYGLGLQVHAGEDNVTVVGHSGSMPGFLASFLVDRAQRTASVVLANGTAGLDGMIGRDLLRIVREHEPAVPQEWRPMSALPPDLEIAGPWFWGPTPLAVRFRSVDTLEIVPLGASGRAAVFRRQDGRWVGLDGYYAGEVLQARRDADGALTHLVVATFVLTRDPYQPHDVQPGGVVPPGWRPLP